MCVQSLLFLKCELKIFLLCFFMLSQICVSRTTMLHIKSESIYSQDCDEDTPNNHPHENLLQSIISHSPPPELSWKKNLEEVKWDLADSTFPPASQK